MAKDPAVLFYTSDFISGTITMTDEERGKYILLLCLQHQKGKLTERELTSVKDMDEVYSKFELLEDGFYYNVRMKEEAEKRKNYSASRSKNRQGKTKEKPLVKDMKNISKTYDNHINNISTSYDKHMENENENVNINNNINENINKNGNENNILQKYLDNCIEYNLDSFKKYYNNIIEYGGLDKIFDKLEYTDSQRNNWSRQINTVKMALGYEN